MARYQITNPDGSGVVRTWPQLLEMLAALDKARRAARANV